MPFQPATTLIICSGVPWDSTYTDTRIFANKDTQNAYFRGLAAFTFDESSYQREQNAMRVNIDAEKLHECNYICYLNANYGNKWMYGFIDRVEFVSGNASRIYFTIDVWQTYYFDLTFKPCFVEREHVNDDTIGANTLPENVELGPYITTNETSLTNDLGNLNIVIYASEKIEDVGMNDPGLVNGFPITCYWRDLGNISTGLGLLEPILNKYAEAGKSDAIFAVFLSPNDFVNPTYPSPWGLTFSGATRTMPYTPVNNKLYCYPYTSLVLFVNGNASVLRYELFDNPSEPLFATCSVFGPNAPVAVIPRNYEGQTDNYQYMQTISKWPALPWKSNFFENWMAQNRASITTGVTNNVIGSLASLGLGIAGAVLAPGTGGISLGITGAAISSGIGLLSNISSTMASIEEAKVIPDKMTGNAEAADLLTAMGEMGFRTYCRTIRPEYMRSIDNYFSRVGYKVNRLKTPNITGRQSWNYVKTVGAEIVGKCPTSALNIIKSSMDNGITFWHTNDVGNYSLSNGVV